VSFLLWVQAAKGAGGKAAPRKPPTPRRLPNSSAKKRAAAAAAEAAEDARGEQLKRALTLVMKLEEALEQCCRHQARPSTLFSVFQLVWLHLYEHGDESLLDMPNHESRLAGRASAVVFRAAVLFMCITTGGAEQQAAIPHSVVPPELSKEERP